jgi:PBP1b-binding outer membrane lipoprotein LpoB
MIYYVLLLFVFLLGDLSSSSEDGKDVGESSTEKDKVLLTALFNGDEISAVYDHNYIETGVSDPSLKHIQERAARSVEEAYRHLQASKVSTRGNGYLGVRANASISRNNASDGGVKAAFSSSETSMLSYINNQPTIPTTTTTTTTNLSIQFSSNNNNNNSSSSSSSSRRFGNHSSSNITSNSSSGLLSNFRSHANASINNNTTDIFQSKPPIAPSSSSSSSSSTSSHITNMHQNRNNRPETVILTKQTATQPHSKIVAKAANVSMQDKIYNRILACFKKVRGNPLSTERILNDFADLDDRFATVFRDQLRRAAVCKNGIWHKI